MDDDVDTVENDEKALREYLSKNKKPLKKSLLAMFPNLLLGKYKLDEIITKYSHK